MTYNNHPPTALITGGSAGLGFTLANFLAVQGCQVIITGRDAVRLESAVTRLRDHGGEAAGIPGDIGDVDHRRQLAETIHSLGRLDILINNAGLGGTKLLVEMEDDEWDRVLDITLNGTGGTKVASVDDAPPVNGSAASVGGVGAILLAALYGRFSVRMVWESSLETVKITAMVFAILIGATAFSMVFTYTGGDWIVEEFMTGLPGEEWGFLILSMLIIMALGFFIDFFEIAFIIIPLLLPAARALGIDLVWFGVMIGVNLQTSFLTPPFGFALFYLRGVAPAEIKTTQIYRGVMPFIAIQILAMAMIAYWPELATWLPEQIS